MATKIYNEPWSPSNINCNWKPEKLARYSFLENKINFNAEGVQLNYGQSGNYPAYDNETNLTDYIEVNMNHRYVFKCNGDANISRGIKYIAYFNSNKEFLSSEEFSGQSSIETDIVTPSYCSFVRITIYKEAWEKCTFKLSSIYLSLEKGVTPLNIVDNKEGTQIYKDLHFEVYVKKEAEIKNFVDSFDLSAFQQFPNTPSYWYYNIVNSLIFVCNTKRYYYNSYLFFNWTSGVQYRIGNKVKVSLYLNYTYYYLCKKEHTSSDSFYTDSDCWVELPENAWLNIDKGVLESNYNQDFPYVGSLVFKNLWGCDMCNYLNTYCRFSVLTICYSDFFAEKLRRLNSYYNKYFEQGYFLDKNPSEPNSLEGFGVRLIAGESFRSDEILGDLSQNNYLDYSVFENSHEMLHTSSEGVIDDTWVASHDSINIQYFQEKISKPFDHWYHFRPARGIPFFKEKSFEDFSLELILQRQDKLGNIFQRIVNLPILVTFTNNLIKCYFKGSYFQNTPYYTAEYLNSNQEYSYYYIGEGGVRSELTIWCPNVKKLSVSSTILNPSRVNNWPKLINADGDEDSPLEGQTCILRWNSDALDIGETIKAIHSIEYSDGENYDKFIFLESIERRSE